MVRKFAFLIAGLLVLTLLLPSTGAAQTACENRDKIAKTLKKDYAEMPVSAGLDNAGRMIEVFASDKGSWTILMTMPSGVSCLLATGKDWMHRGLEAVKDKGIPL
ncbi:MAG: hypothetical protein RIB59_16120 [Rhodospirillales bacterium]